MLVFRNQFKIKISSWNNKSETSLKPPCQKIDSNDPWKNSGLKIVYFCCDLIGGETLTHSSEQHLTCSCCCWLEGLPGHVALHLTDPNPCFFCFSCCHRLLQLPRKRDKRKLPALRLMSTGLTHGQSICSLTGLWKNLFCCVSCWVRRQP